MHFSRHVFDSTGGQEVFSYVLSLTAQWPTSVETVQHNETEGTS